jgi:hypothetical protein
MTILEKEMIARQTKLFQKAFSNQMQKNFDERVVY